MNVYSPRRYGWKAMRRERRRQAALSVIVSVASTFAVLLAIAAAWQ